MTTIDLHDFQGQGQIAALFATYLPDAVEVQPKIRVLTADMSYIACLDRFKVLYPEKFINVGIAEQNMIGVSAGLASEGYQPIALAQATFISMRCYEPVRQYMSYMGYPIILVGLSAGLGMQFMGNSHYAQEDLSIMRSIPGIEVLSPADAGEAVKALQYALTSHKPTYIRLTGSATDKIVYHEDFDYTPEEAHVLRQGQDIVLVATGSMVSRSLETAEILQQAGLSCKVIDMHAIAPLDPQALLDCKSAKLIVTVEEHHTTGGLGSAVADVMATEGGFAPLFKLGIQNTYSVVGDYNFLLEQHRLYPTALAEDIMKRYKTLYE
jgi:transketolase